MNATAKSISILEQASEVISGPRQEEYGAPEVNFQRIAELWSSYHGGTFTQQDVAIMMVLLKVGRINEEATEDTLVDICGYAALAAILD
jgi:hypothetical protein